MTRLWWLYAWLADIWDTLRGPAWWAGLLLWYGSSLVFAVAVALPGADQWVRLTACIVIGAYATSHTAGRASERLG